MRTSFAIPLGIHAHDDIGCGAANTLAAVRAGATHVQGTINGHGERCGNANLCTVIPTLELKMGTRCLPTGALRSSAPRGPLRGRRRERDARTSARPYIGRSAFAHKGGVHVAAMRRNASSYSHVDPALLGNETRILVSELSGKGAMIAKAEELGLATDGSAPDAGEVLQQIKSDEAAGFSFESADASVALLFRRRAQGYAPPFRLVEYKVMVGHAKHGGTFSEATVKIEVGSEVVHTAAEGVGPVHALDAALRKALAPSHPAVSSVHLDDYKVRILEAPSEPRRSRASSSTAATESAAGAPWARVRTSSTPPGRRSRTASNMG